LSDDTASGPLLHQRHTVLILRLTLDQQHQLYQGVVLGLDGQVMGRFRNWQELVALLEQWLSARSTSPSV
jgi:hypothetical protein